MNSPSIEHLAGQTVGKWRLFDRGSFSAGEGGVGVGCTWICVFGFIELEIGSGDDDVKFMTYNGKGAATLRLKMLYYWDVAALIPPAYEVVRSLWPACACAAVSPLEPVTVATIPSYLQVSLVNVLTYPSIQESPSYTHSPHQIYRAIYPRCYP